MFVPLPFFWADLTCVLYLDLVLHCILAKHF